MNATWRHKRLCELCQQKTGELNHIQSTLKEKKTLLKERIKNQINLEKAQFIIQTIGQKTQEQLQYHLNELVSLAMISIFPDPYELKTNFVVRRGKTEVDFLFYRNGIEIDPISASGGGVVDVAALALRFSLFSMQRQRSRNTFILDEPLKWLKGGDLPILGASMIKEISQRLGIQIIMVSHSEELIESADKVITITKDNTGISNCGLFKKNL